MPLRLGPVQVCMPIASAPDACMPSLFPTQAPAGRKDDATNPVQGCSRSARITSRPQAEHALNPGPQPKLCVPSPN